MAQRILHLTLYRKWFDQISDGTKKIEYRDDTPYWRKRLDGKVFDEVWFTNGYGKNRPFMRVEWLRHGYDIGDTTRHAIFLGRVLEVRR